MTSILHRYDLREGRRTQEVGIREMNLEVTHYDLDVVFKRLNQIVLVVVSLLFSS